MPNPSQTVFVTGGTGFLGSFLIAHLLKSGVSVVALARGPDAASRVGAAVRHALEGADARAGLERLLQVCEGDVTDPRLGMDDSTRCALAQRIDAVWHCAASFKGSVAGDEARRVNVTGTRHVLEFARECALNRSISFFHVSTAFAAPCVDGIGLESLAPPVAVSRNAYERSKREAERLVARYSGVPGMEVAILRPSIIVGDSRTGHAAGFTAYYDVLRALEVYRQHRPAGSDGIRIKGSADLPLNIVTIDFVIGAMCRLAARRDRRHLVYNIVNDEPVSAGEALRTICSSLRLDGVRLVEPAEFDTEPMTRLERFFHRMTSFEGPYLGDEVHFDTANFRSELSRAELPAPRMNERLLRRLNESYLRHASAPAKEEVSALA